MSAVVLMFASRRARHQSPVSTGGEGAALLLRYLDLDARMCAAEAAGDFDAWAPIASDLAALRATALRLEPITADDMRLRVVICSDTPARTDRTPGAAMIREARAALGLTPDA